MKIKELMKFLKQSFIDNKKIFLIVLLKSVFLSFSSLFLVVGLGTIVEQLLDGNNLISLLQPIFLYSFIPLIINLIATSLTFYIDYLTRISIIGLRNKRIIFPLLLSFKQCLQQELLDPDSISLREGFYIFDVCCLDRPKPLVTVNGVCILETLLDHRSSSAGPWRTASRRRIFLWRETGSRFHTPLL